MEDSRQTDPAGLSGCFSEFFSDGNFKSVGRDGQSLNSAQGEKNHSSAEAPACWEHVSPSCSKTSVFSK